MFFRLICFICFRLLCLVIFIISVEKRRGVISVLINWRNMLLNCFIFIVILGKLILNFILKIIVVKIYRESFFCLEVILKSVLVNRKWFVLNIKIDLGEINCCI